MAGREHAHPLVPVFDDDLFVGTAEWYAQYRPQYPQQLLDTLVSEAPTMAGDRRLLDLACGPGTVCLRIQHHFDAVLAVDLESDMIEKGIQLARLANVDNIDWRVSRAEDLDLPPESLDLVTVGSAFHRLNRPLIAGRARRWLRPGGLFAEIGSSTGITSGTEPWQQVVAEVYRQWIAKAPHRRPAKRPLDQTLATTEEVLRRAGFVDVKKREIDVGHAWTVDDIVGYLFSTSYASRAVFGDLADGFAGALRSALLAHEANGRFAETLSTYLLTGKRPERDSSG